MATEAARVLGAVGKVDVTERAITDLTFPTLATLRDDLAGFITSPAPTPPELEPGTTT